MKHTLTLAAALCIAAPTFAGTQLAVYDAGTAGNPAVAPDPATVGWTLIYPLGTGVTLIDVSPDGTTGLNAWQIDDAGTATGERAHYEMLFTPQQNADAAAQGWVYEADMRMLNASGRDVLFEYANGTDRYSIFYTISGNDVIADLWLSGGTTYVCTNAMDGNYHSFKYVLAAGAIDADFYYDGTLLGTLPSSGNLTGAPAGGVSFGTGSSGATGGANFNFVSFETANNSGTPYCFGDGSGTQCPCGNNNDGSLPGAGCDNGSFISGAQLTGSGHASLGADTFVLTTIHLEPNNSGLYFQADNDLSPGFIWGDGLQCAGGQLKRLGVRFAGGAGTSDTSGWATPISVRAGNILAGDTKRYQCWYRTTIAPPCGLGVNDFNASNGLEVTWLP